MASSDVDKVQKRKEKTLV
jgi:coiled-coil domain-containing protein 39